MTQIQNIAYIARYYLNLAVALPAECMNWNSVMLIFNRGITGCIPHGMHELKHAHCSVSGKTLLHPSRDAWIEIPLHNHRRMMTVSCIPHGMHELKLTLSGGSLENEHVALCSECMNWNMIHFMCKYKEHGCIPHGMHELKCTCITTKDGTKMLHSPRSAWIEINMNKKKGLQQSWLLDV